MHCHRAPTSHSEWRPEPSDAARALQLESELRLLAPVGRFRLGGQPRPPLWDVMMRGLQSAEAPPDEDEEDDRGLDASALVVKRSRTNSERGRAFRARRKKYEDDLETLVGSLRQEVADLGFLRGVRADKMLRGRNSMGGSLVRLAREYFALFERGMPSGRVVGQKRPPLLLTDDSFEDRQKAFLDCAMDPELQFGDVSGPEALLDQWKKYTSYHSSISVKVVGVEVSGEEDNPMVTVRSDLHVVFSRATFDNVFPHVAHNEELVNKFVGREVVYHGVNRFQFSPKGQILVYDSDVGFVDALTQAGASVSDLALLMQQARIADECRLGDEDNNSNFRVQELAEDNQELVTSPEDNSNDGTDADSDRDAPSENGGGSGSGGEEVRSPEVSRLAIDFLLS
ncbi:hypothetical protein KRP22_008068 [Phytophthora ramorum]|uniref:BZIP domain-containing protein n=1 Tax=Phytophthora ramorum TaxID=164328 RepID=H3GZ25_PHYRM|nr:hypothetical protein KRP23_12916 [Phytophthora ramorum]KAH7505955.1 hypothetical protein KRP22_3922 [Phytophthora ramorum]